MARSQSTCKDCPPGRVQIEAARSQRDADFDARNTWPRRPLLQPIPIAKSQYGQLNAEFKVANDADKKIKQITWECTLVHLDTRQVIARYTFVTNKDIAPHREALLSRKVVVPLNSFYEPKVVSASAPGKPKSLPDVVQAEQVNEVKEIRYADGSVVNP
jgi:hypothetical protein